MASPGRWMSGSGGWKGHRAGRAALLSGVRRRHVQRHLPWPGAVSQVVRGADGRMAQCGTRQPGLAGQDRTGLRGADWVRCARLPCLAAHGAGGRLVREGALRDEGQRVGVGWCRLPDRRDHGGGGAVGRVLIGRGGVGDCLGCAVRRGARPRDGGLLGLGGCVHLVRRAGRGGRGRGGGAGHPQRHCALQGELVDRHHRHLGPPAGDHPGVAGPVQRPGAGR